jgi:hypothetical protein
MWNFAIIHSQKRDVLYLARRKAGILSHDETRSAPTCHNLSNKEMSPKLRYFLTFACVLIESYAIRDVQLSILISRNKHFYNITLSITLKMETVGSFNRLLKGLPDYTVLHPRRY